MMSTLIVLPTSQFNVEQMSQSIVKSTSQSNGGLTSEPDVKPM